MKADKRAKSAQPVRRDDKQYQRCETAGTPGGNKAESIKLGLDLPARDVVAAEAPSAGRRQKTDNLDATALTDRGDRFSGGQARPDPALGSNPPWRWGRCLSRSTLHTASGAGPTTRG